MKNIWLYSIVLVVLFINYSTAEAEISVLQPANGKDSVMYEQLPDDNFGSSDYIYSWPCCGDVKGLIEFDISSFQGTTIDSATLSLYQWMNYPHTLTLGLYRVTSAWNESTVTWNTMPTIDATPVSTLTMTDGYSATWRAWDVTDVVQDWSSGTYENYGLMISRISGTEQIGLLSSENDIMGSDAYDPILSVSYTVVPEPVSSVLFLIGGATLGFRYFRKQFMH